MAEVDEIEVSESVEGEASVEVVGSDDVEISLEEISEREVDIIVSDKLDEADGILMIQTATEHINISSGEFQFSGNVKQLVARFEQVKIPTEHKIQIAHQLSLVSNCSCHNYCCLVVRILLS